MVTPALALRFWQKYRSAASQNSYCTENIVQNMKRIMSAAANWEKKWVDQTTIWSWAIARIHPWRRWWRTWLSSLSTRYIFLTATKEQRSFFYFFLLQGKVDYCFRTNPGQPLAAGKQPLSRTLLLGRSSHYCARNFNLQCLDCYWQLAAPLPHPPIPTLSSVPGSTRNQTFGRGKYNYNYSQTLQTSPTPVHNCYVQLRDKT